MCPWVAAMRDHRRRRPGILTAAAAAIAVVLVAAGPARADRSPSDPATAPITRETRVVDRGRSIIERRVVPFDGQTLTERGGRQVTVTLDAEVLFELDQATLTPEATASLRDLAQTINGRRAAPGISVVGHTDALGTDAHNLDLSQRRAAAVRDFLAPLLVGGDVAFTVEGRGSAEPVAPNTRPDGSDDPEGRRHNRRVEVTFTARSDS